MNETADVIRRFNDAFQTHDLSLLGDIVGENCVMETIDPAPNGTRYEGYDACLAFWEALANDSSSSFEVEDIAVVGDRAIIRWRYHFGEGAENSVRGVNVMHVLDGKIVEALGYAKTGAAGVVEALPGTESG
jgi:ketosteroid isomerase-like protein